MEFQKTECGIHISILQKGHRGLFGLSLWEQFKIQVIRSREELSVRLLPLVRLFFVGNGNLTENHKD